MALPKPGVYEKHIFVGSSKKSLEQAIAAAYERARGSHHYPTSGLISLRVADIYVKGTNPISEYIVVLGPSG